jgi:NADH:ubiquinone oxidoreductase subunit 3 (subunit A)
MQTSWDATLSNVFLFFLAFAIVLIIVLFLYYLGKRIAPSNPTKEKSTTYACGEDVPGVKTQFHSELLRYAAYFTILETVAFILATSMGILGWVPLLYALIAFFAVLVLRK